MHKLFSALVIAAVSLAALVLLPSSAGGQTGTAKTLIVRINGKVDSKSGTVYLTRISSQIAGGNITRRVDIYVNGTVGCRVMVSSLEEALALRDQITSPATTKITCVGTALVANSINEAVVRTSGTTEGRLELQ